MSDWFAGTIYIGGELPAKDLPDFIATIVGEIPGIDQKEINDETTPEKFLEYLNENINEDDGSNIVEADGSLRFYVAEARCGMFEDVEAFCVSNGQTYVRLSDSSGECIAEVEYWMPGMENVKVVAADNEQNPIIDTPVIKYMIDAVQAFNPEDAPLTLNKDSNTHEGFLGNWALKNEWNPFEALKALIENHAPTPPDEVGEFKIV